MEWVLILSIALANNLDNTGAGVALGIARIQISPLVNLWISAVTFLITASSVAFGERLSSLLPGHAAKAVSAIVLCVIGLSVLLPALRKNKRVAVPLLPKRFPLLRRILQDPQQADQDGSRHIDLREGTFLAVALSLNNIGGGLSAGLIHLSIGWTSLLSATFSYLVLRLGGWAGRRLRVGRLGKHAQAVAGMLLIAIGLCQLR